MVLLMAIGGLHLAWLYLHRFGYLLNLQLVRCRCWGSKVPGPQGVGDGANVSHSSTEECQKRNLGESLYKIFSKRKLVLRSRQWCCYFASTAVPSSRTSATCKLMISFLYHPRLRLHRTASGNYIARYAMFERAYYPAEVPDLTQVCLTNGAFL